MAERTQLYQNLHPEHPGSIGPKHAGRRARYSFIGTDDNGRPVRKWHASSALTEQEQRSLQGMVQP